jgi:23S rRNA pseudouridine1911/1915/1917 synthase
VSEERIERLEVGPADAGERIDRFLAARLQGHSRVEVQRWIKEGRVRLLGRSGGPVAIKLLPRTELRAAQSVEVRIPPARRVEIRAEPIGLRVLYSDEHVIVIDKPPGLIVHPAPGHESGTLVSALLYEGGGLSTLGGEDRPGLVHRLDRDTSGVMVVARTDRAHRSLVAQFKSRETEKEYLAIVEANPRRDFGEIEAPIGRSPHDRKKMAIRRDGRPALTRWEVLERFPHGPASPLRPGLALVRCLPKTGRTHQIRVHLKSANMPILCDPLYGRRFRVYPSELRGRPKEAGESPALGRQALHARRLAFAHPETGARVDFEAPLPEDMAAVLRIAREGRAL